MCVPYFRTDGLDQPLLSFSSRSLVGACRGGGRGGTLHLCLTSSSLAVRKDQRGRCPLGWPAWQAEGPEREPSLRCRCRRHPLPGNPLPSSLRMSVCGEVVYSEASKVPSKHPGVRELRSPAGQVCLCRKRWFAMGTLAGLCQSPSPFLVNCVCAKLLSIPVTVAHSSLTDL